MPTFVSLNRHRRHIDGTQDTLDRHAIYATYAIYVPPILSADAAVNARFQLRGLTPYHARYTGRSVLGPQ
jgi:hypothetical protein